GTTADPSRAGASSLSRAEPIGLGRRLVGVAPVGLGAAVVPAGRRVEDLARQLGLDRVRLGADALVGRHPDPFAGRFLGFAGGRLPGRAGAGLRGTGGRGRLRGGGGRGGLFRRSGGGRLRGGGGGGGGRSGRR